MTSLGSNPEELRDWEQFVEERRKYGLQAGREWGHYYHFTAESLLVDHRPDYADAWRRGYAALEQIEPGGPPPVDTDRPARPGGAAAVFATVTSLQHLPMYIMYGWETGIYNEFRHFKTRGFSRAQLIELVLFANLQTGYRGLGHVYNAVSRFLPDLPEEPGDIPFPEGWEPDPDAFKAGLDLSTDRLTDQDRRNIEDWHERTIGYVPKSVAFTLRRNPEFYKWHRHRWEIIFRTLPKQTAPYIMLRQHMLTGSKDALREAVLLGKAWGITDEWILQGIMVSAYFTGFEGMYVAADIVDELLD